VEAHLTLDRLGLERNGRWLFRNISLTLPRGRFIAVVGPSGVGKSSLLGCLAGLIRPSEGAATYRCVQGCDHAPVDFQTRIGIIFQNLLLAENSSVLRNVLCGRLGRYPWWKTLFRFPPADAQEAYAIIADLGLAEYVHRRVGEISGGEQQRVGVARALFQGPEIVLADEPVSNLDVYLAGRVLGILRQHAHEQNRTVLCVLHDPRLVERFADYALSINPGNPEDWRMREVARTAA